MRITFGTCGTLWNGGSWSAAGAAGQGVPLNAMFFILFAFNAWSRALASYVLRFLGLSKYAVWTGFMAMAWVDYDWPDLPFLAGVVTRDSSLGWSWLAGLTVWAAAAVAQRAFLGYSLELRIRRYLEVGRQKKVVLASRDKLSKSLHSLKFAVPRGYGCGMMPGQHIRLQVPNESQGVAKWNCRENLEASANYINRSYTSISAASSDTVEITVRHYPADADAGFPQGGRASIHLVEQLKVGREVMASGPHGQRIYFGDGLFEVVVGQPKMKPRVCAFLAGGSGITPAIAVMREVQAEARRKADRVEASRLMDFENDVAVEVFDVMHLNRSAEDALPLEFYLDKSQEEQLIRINVQNYVTGADAHNRPTGTSEEQRKGHCTWHVRSGLALSKELIAAAFPKPADDVLVVVCGPHSFVNACKPSLQELGFEHVVPMW